MTISVERKRLLLRTGYATHEEVDRVEGLIAPPLQASFTSASLQPWGCHQTCGGGE